MTDAQTDLFAGSKLFRFGALLMLATVVLFLFATSRAAQGQTFNVLYNFGASSADPRWPGAWGGYLTQGRDGNLYGTGYEGGANGAGAAFNVTPTGTLRVVYDFGGGHGLFPWGRLTMGTDGNFYGATDGAATPGAFGSLFKLTPDGDLVVMHNFSDVGDGKWPEMSPIEGRDGAFYGTTGGYGGDYITYSTVYKITATAKLTTLHQFDFAGPTAPLAEARDGNFFGTAYAGGANGRGTVFKITPSGQYTVLYNFDGVQASPSAVVQGNDSNLYGTANGGTHGCGVVFKIADIGAFTVLHDFDGADGCLPNGLVQATDGNFYGLTAQGGTMNLGTIYRIDPNGMFTVLHNFDSGYWNLATLLQHTNGILYGVTSEGGTYGYGTFYSLDMGLPPFVSLVPGSGQVGKNIGILGQGFTGTTSVLFNGIPATFKVVSDTFLEALVPNGALSGVVTVTTAAGTLASDKIFRVTPKVFSFNPTSGVVGTPVVITGTGFAQTTKVGFGGVTATSFTVESDTQIIAIVPSGAVTGKIAIATQGGHDRSARVFTVTP